MPLCLDPVLAEAAVSKQERVSFCALISHIVDFKNKKFQHGAAYNKGSVFSCAGRSLVPNGGCLNYVLCRVDLQRAIQF